MVRTVDFSTLMASTVHDLKNVIAAIGQAYESLHAQMPETLQRSADARLIERESGRLDAMLMQLLGLYKLEHQQLKPNPTYHRLDDFFEDLVNRHKELLSHRGIECRIVLAEDGLEGFFDAGLLATVLDNALGNALRHCRHALCLSGWREQDRIWLSLCDDGPGFAPERLGPVCAEQTGSTVDPQTGSTGLGLYFAERMVALHDLDGQPALLQLRNGGALPGACVEIALPLPSLF